MKLFEVTNGYTGESYVRVYVFVETVDEAIAIARATYERHGRDATTLSARECIDTTTVSYGFCTLPSDSGWEEESIS